MLCGEKRHGPRNSTEVVTGPEMGDSTNQFPEYRIRQIFDDLLIYIRNTLGRFRHGRGRKIERKCTVRPISVTIAESCTEDVPTTIKRCPKAGNKLRC